MPETGDLLLDLLAPGSEPVAQPSDDLPPQHIAENVVLDFLIEEVDHPDRGLEAAFHQVYREGGVHHGEGFGPAMELRRQHIGPVGAVRVVQRQSDVESANLGVEAGIDAVCRRDADFVGILFAKPLNDRFGLPRIVGKTPRLPRRPVRPSSTQGGAAAHG